MANDRTSLVPWAGQGSTPARKERDDANAPGALVPSGANPSPQSRGVALARRVVRSDARLAGLEPVIDALETAGITDYIVPANAGEYALSLLNPMAALAALPVHRFLEVLTGSKTVGAEAAEKVGDHFNVAAGKPVISGPLTPVQASELAKAANVPIDQVVRASELALAAAANANPVDETVDALDKLAIALFELHQVHVAISIDNAGRTNGRMGPRRDKPGIRELTIVANIVSALAALAPSARDGLIAHALKHLAVHSGRR